MVSESGRLGVAHDAMQAPRQPGRQAGDFVTQIARARFEQVLQELGYDRTNDVETPGAGASPTELLDIEALLSECAEGLRALMPSMEDELAWRGARTTLSLGAKGPLLGPGVPSTEQADGTAASQPRGAEQEEQEEQEEDDDDEEEWEAGDAIVEGTLTGAGAEVVAGTPLGPQAPNQTSSEAGGQASERMDTHSHRLSLQDLILEAGLGSTAYQIEIPVEADPTHGMDDALLDMIHEKSKLIMTHRHARMRLWIKHLRQAPTRTEHEASLRDQLVSRIRGAVKRAKENHERVTSLVDHRKQRAA